MRDTRKTTPGLRALEKYAVRCGGGVNHRMSLSDAALVKDNHVVAAGGVRRGVRRRTRACGPTCRSRSRWTPLDQLDEALDAGADLVLLDNMAPDELRRGRRVARRPARPARGLRRADARDGAAVAATGVDYVAVGALTHSAPVLDIGARPPDGERRP